MPKSLVLGNGNILIALDSYAQVRDFYFPYVGLENQTSGRFVHKLGVFSGGSFHWFDDGTWEITIDSEKETLAGIITAIHEKMGIHITIRDVVYNEKNIFIREIAVTNTTNRPRSYKLFFHQAFELYESHRGDTAYYDPVRNVIVHYKGRRVFLVNARLTGRGFDDYSVGLFNIEGKEGTYRDAEDGHLQKNAIEHGMVDSVIGMSMELPARETNTMHYWVAVAREYRDVSNLNTYVLERTPQHCIKTTKDFWHAWSNREEFDFADLDTSAIELFKKSLLIIKTHVDNRGSILASGDSDMLQYGRDTYSYMWPRDGAFCVISLIRAGDHNAGRRFFDFCRHTVMDEGYFLHKYRPDTSLGSSWHPWIRGGHPSLPIQEDETALVVYALWEYYIRTKDLEFIEEVYDHLIKRPAYFMVEFIDHETGLPKPSYDLWEEKYGIHTFTASTVVAGLMAASGFAKILGKDASATLFAETAAKIKNAIITHLYNEKESSFYKMINVKNGSQTIDPTIDMSSVYGIAQFGIMDVNDPRLHRAMESTKKALWCKSDIGGIARYQADQYYATTASFPGNPWFITTLWLAQYQIAGAASKAELLSTKQWFTWVSRFTVRSGILSEQMHPVTGRQLSVAPLTWSHAEYVVTVLQYLEKYKKL